MQLKKAKKSQVNTLTNTLLIIGAIIAGLIIVIIIVQQMISGSLK
jgi:hypothetical protein